MNEIKKLQLEIIRHKNLYYQGRPEISDFEYDSLEEQLRKIDPENAVLQMVGTSYFDSEKIQHDQKMLSLNKTYKLEDLISWADNKDIISTFKVDGSSCSILYKEGKFELAKTRGDGKFGENISNKILCIEHIPKILTGYKKDFEIRGEVYCREDEFVHLSQEMEKMGLEKPTSQRNIVAGLLGRKENIELSRFLRFQAFELISDQFVLSSEEDKFKTLQLMGFETPDFHINRKKEDFIKRLDEAKEFMSQGDYLIDGLVFTYNDLKIHSELGETAHHPRYKMAFKFQGETKNTVIKSISWQVSRNGILTPVANVAPTELSGAKVSRVTLHNFGLVNQFKLKAGDEIEIVRSGEVIPKFLGVVKSSDSTFKIPESCPSCSEKVFVDDIRLICKNEICPDKVKDEILNYIQKIGIDDLSGKRLEELIKTKLVTNISSLYDLTAQKLMQVEKVKDKLANKIMNNIENSKNVDLITFLSALGISGGAYNKCEKIVDHGYDTIEKIMALKVEDLIQIESFAQKSATEFISSFKTKESIVKALLAKGFSFKDTQQKVQSKIAGKKFCITGTLTMKRSDLQKLIKTNGATAVSSVSKATDFLITNDKESSSSKFKKAKDLNIPIISENDFMEMLN